MPFCSCSLFSCSTVKMNNYIKMSDSLSLKYLPSFPLKKYSPSLQYTKVSVLHGTHSDTDSHNVSFVCVMIWNKVLESRRMRLWVLRRRHQRNAPAKMTFDQRFHRAEGADSDPRESTQAEREGVELWDMNSKELHKAAVARMKWKVSKGQRVHGTMLNSTLQVTEVSNCCWSKAPVCHFMISRTSTLFRDQG